MKISINNFKSIGSLANYEMRPLTILSGTNSSGKSSFIQLLLLLKQTIAIDSKQFPLLLNGDFLEFHKYLDIIKGKSTDNKLKIELIFNKSELINYKDFYEISFYEAFDNYDLHIMVEFDFKENQIFVDTFEVKFVVDSDEKRENFILFKNNKEKLEIKTDVAIFNDDLLYRSDFKVRKINYSSFIPTDFEIQFSSGTTLKAVPRLDGIKALLKDFFDSLNYIEPLRQKPEDEYKIVGNKQSVGGDGIFVAEILCELSEIPILYFIVEEKDDIASFTQRKDRFIDAVKYWICERFKMCSDIYSKKVGDSYVIYVKSLSGIESTIKHVGFGVSQVLPIIVEGLRLNIGETLILEQPEIHLHPKVQSSISDFLISMIKLGKKVIIETHSDHIITRIRRRIVEDSTNELDNKVLLTFVEVGANDILFRNIGISNLGNLDYFPEDFIEKPDVELKAILKAQMKKRLSN